MVHRHFNTESESGNIINLLLVLLLIKSKARSTALASAVKLINRQVYVAYLLWLPDITAQPTFESSFDPSV